MFVFWLMDVAQLGSLVLSRLGSAIFQQGSPYKYGGTISGGGGYDGTTGGGGDEGTIDDSGGYERATTF